MKDKMKTRKHNDAKSAQLTKNTVDSKKERCYNCGRSGHKSDNCQDKEKGKKCFNCNQFGHVSADCSGPKLAKVSQKTNETAETIKKKAYPVRRVEHFHGMKKTVSINGREMIALIDTGSEINLMRLEKYDELGKPTLNTEALVVTGLGQHEVKTTGGFRANDIKIMAEIQVIPSSTIQFDVIFGQPLLQDSTIIIDCHTLKLTKPAPIDESTGDEEKKPEIVGHKDNPQFKDKEENPLCCITLNDDELNLDVGNPEYFKTVADLINNYQPKATKETNIRMKIILKDDQPVYRRPRRLSRSEQQEVVRQIKQWLEDGIVRPSSSEYASLIILVKKKTGDTRICGDFRELNKKTIRNHYLLWKIS